MEFVCIFYCIFELGGFIGLCFRRFHTYPHLIFYLLKILGVYLHEVIYIFHRFSKSPSLLKLKSESESYRVFCECRFLPVLGSVQPSLGPGQLGLNRHLDWAWTGQVDFYHGTQPVLAWDFGPKSSWTRIGTEVPKNCPNG
jgi:hypothetical protein